MRVRLIFAGVLMLASTVLAGAQAPRPDADPRIEKIVASVSEARLKELLSKLVSFGTRNTLSDADNPTRGIGAARNWILEEMRRSSEKLRVNFDTHQIAQQGRITRPVELRNIVAILPGKSPRRIYVTGHYDTVNIGGQNVSNAAAPGAAGGDRQTSADFNANVDANGANDDGSGTVLMMELARAFAESGVQFDATLVFVAWAGEEQGLVGSNVHTQDLAANKVPIEAVFNNDIVGNSLGGNGFRDAESVRVYAIGPEDSPARALARYIKKTASVYVPSHRIRMLAPPAPKVTNERGANMLSRDPSGYDAAMRWVASPGAVAYRIYWRDTWNNDWDFSQTVGNVTQFTLKNVNIDDFAFGVSAIGADGQESLVSSYVSPVRAGTPIKRQ